MPVPTQDPRRLIDERIRNYRMSTPRGAQLLVALGGPADPVTILLIRPLEEGLGVERVRLPMSAEEGWALLACLADGLSVAGDPPDWATQSIGPTHADGGPLPPLPGASPAEPV